MKQEVTRLNQVVRALEGKLERLQLEAEATVVQLRSELAAATEEITELRSENSTLDAGGSLFLLLLVSKLI